MIVMSTYLLLQVYDSNPHYQKRSVKSGQQGQNYFQKMNKCSDI